MCSQQFPPAGGGSFLDPESWTLGYYSKMLLGLRTWKGMELVDCVKLSDSAVGQVLVSF